MSGPEPELVTPNLRTRVLGPVLAIEAVNYEDAGTYRCVASNIVNEKSMDVRLAVTATLHVEVMPNVLSIHLGGTADFKCNVASVVSNGTSTGTSFKQN